MRYEGYYRAAYTVAIAIYVIYAGSLWWRARALARREAAAMEALARGDQPAVREAR